MKLHRTIMALSLGLSLAGMAHAEDWQTAKNEDGIQVSLADVQGSKYKAYRGVVTINASVAKIRDLQEKDAAAACKWIYNCISQKLLDHKGNQAWTYTQFKAPGPVSNRDSVLEITTEQGADGSVTRTLKGLPSYQSGDPSKSIPAEEKGFVRVAKVAGFWKLVPKAEGVTEVTYQVHTEPGGSVPSWVANKFVVDAPYNTLKDLKALAEK